jgi:hypothetical protein
MDRKGGKVAAEPFLRCGLPDEPRIIELPWPDRASGNGLPFAGDVPRSPWPSMVVVQDLGRLYRLRRRVGL